MYENPIRTGPRVHAEPILARSSRTADCARQEPSAESSVMSLALRRTVFLDGERRPDDYNIIHKGQIVGRIYRMNGTGRELWRWTQSGLAQPRHGPNGGVLTLSTRRKPPS